MMRRPLAAMSLVLALCAPARALAGDDKAAAQALFYEARNLMQQHKYAEACAKLDQSLKLDHGLGTEFNLADCNEKLGKTATAWAGFVDVADAARKKNQGERERVATSRAKALEPKLAKIVIEVPIVVEGLEVTRDGISVGDAVWGASVPVDPGAHRVTATAPGKQPWEATVTASEGRTVKVTVPTKLEPVASATKPAIAAPKPVVVPPPPPVEEAPPPKTTTTAAEFPAPVVERGTSAQKIVGYTVAAVGVAGLGVSAGFGLSSLSKRNDSRAHCSGDICDAQGVELRDSAVNRGNVATYSAIAGGAALLGGIILILTAPSSERPADRSSFRAAPTIGQNSGGFVLQGVFQ